MKACQVADFARQKIEQGKKAVEAVVDYGKQKVEEVKQKAGEIIDAGKQKAAEILDAGKKAVNQAIDTGKKTIQNVATQVQQAICSTAVGKPICDIVRDASSCYWAIQKSLASAPAAVKSAVESLRRWAGGIAGVTSQIVSGFGQLRENVRQAVSVCREWVGRSVKTVTTAVKEAVRSTSLGKPVCDIVAEAASCYEATKSTVDSAPTAVRNAIFALSRFKGGVGAVTEQLVKGFASLKSLVTNSLKVCKKWASKTVAKGVQAVKDKYDQFMSLLDGLTCEKVVEAAGSYDPLNIVLKAVPALRTCRVEMQKGFICKIPNLVKDIVTPAQGLAEGRLGEQGPLRDGRRGHDGRRSHLLRHGDVDGAEAPEGRSLLQRAAELDRAS